MAPLALSTQVPQCAPDTCFFTQCSLGSSAVNLVLIHFLQQQGDEEGEREWRGGEEGGKRKEEMGKEREKKEGKEEREEIKKEGGERRKEGIKEREEKGKGRRFGEEGDSSPVPACFMKSTFCVTWCSATLSPLSRMCFSLALCLLSRQL